MGNAFILLLSSINIRFKIQVSLFFFFAHLTFSISFRFLTFTAKNHAQCFPISLTELQWLCSHCLKFKPLVVRGRNEASFPSCQRAGRFLPRSFCLQLPPLLHLHLPLCAAGRWEKEVELSRAWWKVFQTISGFLVRGVRSLFQ